MGCDIHPQIQVKTSFRDAWVTVAIPSDHRTYLFFELLTGQRARNGFGGVMPPLRGLPADLGEKMSGGGDVADYEFGDHSFTWFTLAEMKEALPLAEAFIAGLNDPEWSDGALERYRGWISLAEECGKSHGADDDSVRFVLGYDS